MPTAAIATAAALALADEERQELVLVTVAGLSLLTGFATIAVICGWLMLQGRPPNRRR